VGEMVNHSSYEEALCVDVLVNPGIYICVCTFLRVSLTLTVHVNDKSQC
jgi:hypothetical protein